MSLEFQSKVEVRREWKEIVEYIKSDLYKIAEETLPDFDGECDQEYVSPLGWRVRLRRCDLHKANGKLQIEAWVYDPNDDLYRHQEDVRATDFWNGRMIP